jgi:hypothetical protein
MSVRMGTWMGTRAITRVEAGLHGPAPSGVK